MAELRTTRIPAGKYAGHYREAINAPTGGAATGEYNFKHVVCGVCETRYRAYKAVCPSCGGDDR